MSDFSREQFASAVSAAITSFQHLAREVDKLVVDLREALAEGPDALTPVRGTFGKSGKSGKDQGRIALRYEYGMLFGRPTDDEPADEDEEQEDEEGDETTAKKRKGKPTELAADEPLLAVRVALYDPRQQSAFEPRVEYAVMRNWRVGELVPPVGTRFVMARYMLRRIPRALGTAGSIEKGLRLYTRATVKGASGGKSGKTKKGVGRHLSLELPLGIKSVPLHSLETADSLDDLVKGLKAAWAEALQA